MCARRINQWPLSGVDLQTLPDEIGLPNWALLDDFGDRPIQWEAEVEDPRELLQFFVVPGIAANLFEVYAIENLRTKVGYFPNGEEGTGYLIRGDVEEGLAGLIRRYGIDPYELVFRPVPIVSDEASLRDPPAKPMFQDRELSGGPGSEWVYIVEAGGLFKIGVAQDVTRRLRSLQTGSSVPLRLVGTVTGGYAREAELHKRFRPFRLHGEWFDLGDRVATVGGWGALLGDDFCEGVPTHRPTGEPQRQQLRIVFDDD